MQARFICSEIIPLPEEVKRELNIITIPNPINIDGTEYLDNQLPFSTEEFSAMLMDARTERSIHCRTGPFQAQTILITVVKDRTPTPAINS